MVGAGPPLKYPDSHIVRAGVQVVLLGELWKLAFINNLVYVGG